MKSPSIQPHLPALALAMAFLAIGITQVMLLPRVNINWDEFFFLSKIHDAIRGTLWHDFQSFYIHFFGWLPKLSGDEIEQVIAGRWVMLSAELITVFLIYLASRSFVSPVASAFAGLVWLSSGFVLVHGFSFRADPLATVLLMGALTIMIRFRPRVGLAAVSGGLGAVAVLVTIKSVLWLPAFLGVLAWQFSRSSSDELRRMIGGVSAGAILSFCILYLWHIEGLPDHPDAGTAILGGALHATVLEAGLLPRHHEVWAWITSSAAALVLMVLGVWRDRIALWFIAPLLSLLFYRNAFPYFFPFIAAPAMIAVSLGAEQLRGRTLYFIPFILLMLGSIGNELFRVLPHGQAAQRQLVSAVHEIFPEPVPYIDRNGMIASFPRHGFFMSTWGMNKYRRGAPVMADILKEHTPPLLIANGPALASAMAGRVEPKNPYALLPEDARVLQDAYLHYWGAIYVAGLSATATPSGESVHVGVTGRYRIESQAPVKVDGESYGPGESVFLERGEHRISARDGTEVQLIWGAANPPPEMPPLPKRIYYGF